MCARLLTHQGIQHTLDSVRQMLLNLKKDEHNNERKKKRLQISGFVHTGFWFFFLSFLLFIFFFSFIFVFGSFCILCASILTTLPVFSHFSFHIFIRGWANIRSESCIVHVALLQPLHCLRFDWRIVYYYNIWTRYIYIYRYMKKKVNRIVRLWFWFFSTNVQ